MAFDKSEKNFLHSHWKKKSQIIKINFTVMLAHGLVVLVFKFGVCCLTLVGFRNFLQIAVLLLLVK